MRDREPKSPYARYKKKPYRYSDLYYRWAKLVRETGTDDTDEALEADNAHRRAFNIPLRAPDPLRF